MRTDDQMNFLLFPLKHLHRACFTFRNLGHCSGMPLASKWVTLSLVADSLNHLPECGNWVEIHLYPGVTQSPRLQKGEPPPKVQASLRARKGAA